MPESSLVSVDLPAPLSPTSAVTSPRWRSRSTSDRACTPPKCLLSPRPDRIGSSATAVTARAAASGSAEGDTADPLAELLLGVQPGVDDGLHVARVDAL